MNYKIYGLKVIYSDEIRYVGYTKRTLEQRLYHHFFDAKSGLTYRKCNWIRFNNYNIEITLIEDGLTYEQALEREVYWVKQYKNLVNMTEGGDKNPMESLEVKKKHAEIMKSIKNPHFGKDNWMTTEDGRKLMSERSKKMWSEGKFKAPPNKNIEYDILHDLYIVQNKKAIECAQILNTTYRSITRNLGRLKIKKYKKNG